MRNLFLFFLTFVSLFSLTAISCVSTELHPLNPCTVSGVSQNVRVDPIDKIDLLFVIDNSGSMAEEQQKLAQEIEGIMDVLVTGDQDGDGIPEFTPVLDINVGVVTSDGGNPTTQTVCETTSVGDDGKIGVVSNRPGDPKEDPPFLRLRSNATPPSDKDFSNAVDFTAAVVAAADVGTEGCGIERQIEMMTKAVAPSSATIFTGIQGNRVGGQGNQYNEGFVREDSLLAVILVTDEEDCSLVNPYGYPFVLGQDLNMRCMNCVDPDNDACSAEPTSVFVNELVGNGTDRLGIKDPNLFVFGALVGLPDEDYSPTDFESWLSDAAMNEYASITDGEYETTYGLTTQLPNSYLVPKAVCEDFGPDPENPGSDTYLTIAAPGRRYVELARDIEAVGGSASVHSICARSYKPAIDDIVEQIAAILSSTCLPRKLNRTATGEVPCQVLVTLPNDPDSTEPGAQNDDCSGRPGLEEEPVGFTEGSPRRPICRAIQRVSVDGTRPTEAGWYYAEGESLECPVDRKQQILFSDISSDEASLTVPAGADIDFSCLQPVQGSNGEVTLGTPCGEDPTICAQASPALAGAAGSPFKYKLACDVVSNTCVAVCNDDLQNEDCAGGYVCAGPAENTIHGSDGTFNVPDLPEGFSGGTIGQCVNPTCGN